MSTSDTSTIEYVTDFFQDMREKLASVGEFEESAFIRRFLRSVERADQCRRDERPITKEFPFSREKLLDLLSEHQDSSTVIQLLDTIRHFDLGCFALREGETQFAVSMWASALRKDIDTVTTHLEFIEDGFLDASIDAVDTVCTNKSEDTETRALALYVKSYFVFFQGQRQKVMTFIRLAQILQPEDPDFPALEGWILGTSSSAHEAAAAMEAFQRARDQGCTNLFLALLVPGTLAFNAQMQEKAICLMEEFVRRAEPDHPYLPTALYNLALFQAAWGTVCLGVAKRYFILAEQADQRRLPLFEDHAKRERTRAHILLKRYHACGNEECPLAGGHACTGCGKVYYCSTKCQSIAWPIHKKWCKKQKATRNKKTDMVEDMD